MIKQTQALWRKNNALEDTLSFDAKHAICDIVVYIRHANISMYNQELIRNDILHMMLDGEQRGSQPHDVIGNDYKRFCDDVLFEIPKRTQFEKLLVTFSDIIPAIISLIVIWLGFYFLPFIIDQALEPTIVITVGNILTVVLILCIAYGSITWVTKQSFHHDALKNKKVFLILFMSSTLCVSSNIIFSQPLFKIHFIFIVIMIIILYFIYRSITNRFD